MRTALALAAILVAAPAMAEPGEAPKPLQGVWTETALDCGAVTAGKTQLPDGRRWLRIAPRAVSGSTTGRLLSVTGPRSIETTGSEFEGVSMNYELQTPHMLGETIGGARAAALYLRCQ